MRGSSALEQQMKLHELAVHVRQLQGHAAELQPFVTQFLFQQAVFDNVKLNRASVSESRPIASAN